MDAPGGGGDADRTAGLSQRERKELTLQIIGHKAFPTEIHTTRGYTWRESHRRLSHGRVSYSRVSQGRVSPERVCQGRLTHRRLSHRRLFHRRVSHRRVSLRRVSNEGNPQTIVLQESPQQGEVMIVIPLPSSTPLKGEHTHSPNLSTEERTNSMTLEVGDEVNDGLTGTHTRHTLVMPNAYKKQRRERKDSHIPP